MNWPLSRLFFAWLASFLAGALLGNFFIFQKEIFWIFGIAFLVYLIFWVLFPKRFLVWILTFLIFAVLGFLYANLMGKNRLFTLDTTYFHWLFIIRDKFTSTIFQVLPEPQASFLNGLLLGIRTDIPKDLLNDFNRTGTSHILALSGFNVTIILAALARSTRIMGRIISFWVGIIGILLFTIITGAQATVVRAALMGGLFLLGDLLGRQKTFRNIIAVAAFLMVLEEPSILGFNLSFQLSFAALIGLLTLSPVLENLFNRFSLYLKIPYFIREAFTSTLGAVIFTLPILLFAFGKISLISPLSNILILPFIPLTMLLGFLGGILGLTSVVLGQWFSLLAFVLLTYIIKVVQILSNLSFSQIELGKLNIVYLIILYLGLALFVWWLNRKYKKDYEPAIAK